MLEGPSNQESSLEEDQECVITPSTTVKFNTAVKERNRINFMRNSLLLIGAPYSFTRFVNHAENNHCCPLVLTFYRSYVSTTQVNETS